MAMIILACGNCCRCNMAPDAKCAGVLGSLTFITDTPVLTVKTTGKFIVSGCPEISRAECSKCGTMMIEDNKVAPGIHVTLVS